MKHFLVILLVSLSFFTNAQVDKAAIKAQAVELANATIKSDWDKVTNYTYPKIIEMMGGRERMIEAVSSSMSQQSIIFESIDFGEVGKMYKTGEDNLFCLIPQTIVINTSDQRIKSESHLLAVSENSGKKWYFIDTAQLTMDNIQAMLPNYNMDLKLPAKTQPVMLDK